MQLLPCAASNGPHSRRSDYPDRAEQVHIDIIALCDDPHHSSIIDNDRYGTTPLRGIVDLDHLIAQNSQGRHARTHARHESLPPTR